MRALPHQSLASLRARFAIVGAFLILKCRPPVALAWRMRVLMLILMLKSAGSVGVAQTTPQEPAFTIPTGSFDPWLPHGPERAWNGLASSADGRFLAATARADRIHTSSDYGETWTPRGSVQAWQAIACSADGQRLVAVVEGGGIHTSSDAGATWVERESTRKWSAVASSADGLRLAAVVNGGRIHTSTNGGVSWSEAGPVQAWSAIASSADGLKLVATVFDGPIHVSIDGGQTWATSGPVKLWKAITSSADGTRLAAAVWDGRINTSTNSALTWTEWESNPPRRGGRLHRWRSIAFTADGRTLAAAEEPSPPGWAGWGLLSFSPDFGRTWEDQGRRTTWSAIVCSADGLRWVAAAEGDRIYTQYRTTSHHTVYASVDSDLTTVPRFVTFTTAEPARRLLRFRVTNDHPELFRVPPKILPDGTLTFAAATKLGRAIVTVTAHEENVPENSESESRDTQTFGIQIHSRAFEMSQWTRDADSGISRSSTLWSYRFASITNPPAIIDGVIIPPVPETQPAIPGRFSLIGLDHKDGLVNFLSAKGGIGSARLASRGIHGPPKMSLTLEGLTPGVPYTLHVLGLSVGNPLPVPAIWSAGAEHTILEAHQFGLGGGFRVSHSFVASASTYQVFNTPMMEDGWFLCGLALNSTPSRMVVEQPGGNPVPAGDLRSFDSRPLGTDTHQVFTLRNTGIVPLNSFRFTKSGPNPDDFDVVAVPAAALPGSGGTSSFSVEFSPTALGPRNATLKIESSDPQPFVLHLTGTGLPEDAVLVRDIPDQVIDEDGNTGPLELDLGESQPNSTLEVSAKSGDPTLVPNSNIVIQGTDRRRRVVITPAADRFGSTLIRIRTSDGTRTACHLFRVTVNPVNDPPRFRISPGTPVATGDEWISRAPRLDWRAIALSYDGRRQVAVPWGGRIHVSTDGGNTWQSRGDERRWTSVAASADGSHLVASANGGHLFTSSDAGHTWIPRAEERDWIAVASSSDGSRLAAAVEGGQLYTSSDAGISWVARERNRAWKSIATSGDGQTLAAVAMNGLIHVSTDAGQTWAARGSTQPWSSIASSSDGKRIAAAVNDGRIYVSTNSGVSWNPGGEQRFWQAISMSADGQLLAASETLGRVFLSSDFGKNWTECGGVHDGGGLAISGDGTTLAAPIRNGSIELSAARVEPHTLTVDAKSGANTIREFVTGLSPGPENESDQAVSLVATNSNPTLFAVQPLVDGAGTLSFTPAGHAGSSLVTLIASDSGGTTRGGRATTEPRVFRIEVRGEGFSYGPWLDEGSSGISSSATLWAYRFSNDDANLIHIHGMPVPNLAGIRPQIPGHFALAGMGGLTADGNQIAVKRGGPSLGGGFVHGGHPAMIILDRLVPGTRYILLCFGVGFGGPGEGRGANRSNRWASGADEAIIDEQTYGASFGIRVAYSFTADAPNRIITANEAPGGAPWHFYGLALNSTPARLVLTDQTGRDINRETTVNFDRHGTGTDPVDVTLTLSNSGVVPLREVLSSIDGPQAGDFHLVAVPASTLSGGESTTTATLRFVPTGPGPRTARFHITSNDSIARRFTLQLMGMGIPPTAENPPPR